VSGALDVGTGDGPVATGSVHGRQIQSGLGGELPDER
jgi:hypothetical protein